MFLGCDIGTGFSKAVLIDDGKIKATAIIATEADPRRASNEILRRVLDTTSIKQDDIKGCATTGWGRTYVPVKHQEEGLMNCLAKGANHVLSSCRTVIDVGAQHSMAISIDGNGQVMEFRQNDRCAAGSGRFLEIISEALQVPLEDVSSCIMDAVEKINVTAQCAVFAESEVIAHVNDGKPVGAILTGIIDALGRSLVTVAKRLSVHEDIVLSGGMAKNGALVEVLEKNLGKSIHIASPDPQLLAAFGAALLAKEVDK
jgi:predicted CoA-substrate-specific enzyme activase